MIALKSSPSTVILLEAEGHKVLTCLTSEEAFEALKQITPHLIILDFHLKEMNGNEFIEKLKELRLDIFAICPIVFHSALDHIPDSQAIGHIAKFSDMNLFIKEVTKYLQMRQQ